MVDFHSWDTDELINQRTTMVDPTLQMERYQVDPTLVTTMVLQLFTEPQ